MSFVLASPAGAQSGLEPAGDSAAEPAESVQGTLRVGRTPVEGVTVTVEGPEGEPVGEATTDSDGTWTIPLPGPGTYRIALDEESLPEGVELSRPDQAVQERPVRAGQDRTVLFALTSADDGGAPARRAREGPSFGERFAQASLNGVRFGLIIAMAAIGLSLIFGTTGLVNFAHGEFVTFGAIVAWYFNRSGPELHLVFAALATIALAAMVGGVLDRAMWRPLRSRNVGLFQLLVVTIGLALLARHVMLLFFGGRSQPYRNFTIQERIELGPFATTPRDLTVMAMSALILVGVATMLQRTRTGKAMRAVSDDSELSEASGIDVQRIVMIVWMLGAGLAATGGIFLGTVETVSWLMGFRLLLLMFAGVILGGLGTAYGAMLGSLVVGFVTEVSTLWFSSELKNSWGLLVLILVLLVRPHGILGVRERIG